MRVLSVLHTFLSVAKCTALVSPTLHIIKTHPGTGIQSFSHKKHKTLLHVQSSVGFQSIDLPKSSKKSKLSIVAKWHAERRRAMIKRHPEILSLETSRSLSKTLPLLLLSNVSLATLSVISGTLSSFNIFCLAFGVGSVFSLWQLQILHEVLHGSMLGAGTKLHRKFHRPLLFLGSLPSAFGYWLYLAYGHLSHHSKLGVHSLNDAFVSDKMDLADGDVLFVNHRMNMKGESGPKIGGLTLSIGRFFYQFWKPGDYIRNAGLFSISFLLERGLLMMNDLVVAITGRNYFFPNKPDKFHKHVALYTRVGLLTKVVLCILAGSLSQAGTTMNLPIPTQLLPLLSPLSAASAPAMISGLSLAKFWWSWKPILFLMLSETLWSLPPHPACAMFITNHGSNYEGSNEDAKENCQPSASTYAGKWYSFLTLGTNYHVEHHDFPTMPLDQLGKLKDIAGPDFYGSSTKSNDNVWKIMKKAFSYPDFYACMDAGGLRSIP